MKRGTKAMAKRVAARAKRAGVAVKKAARGAPAVVGKAARKAPAAVGKAARAAPAAVRKAAARLPARRTSAPAGSVELKLPPLVERTLPSGLQVIAAERGPLPLVSMRLVFRAGSVVDPKGKFGLADFTARLLRRGTAKMTAEQIDEAVEFVGASLGVGVGEDATSVAITTPVEHLGPMLDVVATLVREPTFPEAEVTLARERTLAHLANDLDEPSVVADRAFVRALWGDHPYGHDVGGTSADVATFTREDAVRFHREQLGPKLATLIVVGAADAGTVLREAERAFAGWEGGPEAPTEAPRVDAIARPGQVVLVDKPDQTQSQVRIGCLAFPMGHPDYFPATAFNIALGGGFTSRLVDEIRVNRGLSYSAGSFFDLARAGGIFAVSTFTKTESTREIIDVALGEVGQVRERGITAKELRNAQTYLAGLYPLRTETNEAIAAGITDARLNGLGDDWVARFRDRLRAVTLAEANAAAARYCFAQPPAIVVVGRASEVRPLLEGLGPVTVVPASEYE